MSDLRLHFTDPARRAAIVAAAEAEGIGVEEFVLEAAYERALRVNERHASSERPASSEPEPEGGAPRWLQGTYQVSHRY
ncbi:type II toxin -antitoxin system TacA 1-like antitoxin [Nonomuraea candida]|uniref:type II toxin -antitoxin system TacA 1-like antitoxin n=1 Tax=Nonomuraea candida TaxID=359159 RepID=UPI0012F9A45C|nr:DUF1778 domain-containing protein [Nonomuraea candida]